MRNAEELVSILWRGHHTWPATYGNCCECKVESARGGGLCVKCAEKELGTLVGPSLAHNFHESIKITKALEREILEYEDPDEQ